MTERERMLSGQLYRCQGEELLGIMARARRLTGQINETRFEQVELRVQLLKQLLGHTGDHVYVEPSFRCDYGVNISVGDHFFANYDCIIVDVCPVTIGRNVFFGPRVCVYTATHPIDAQVRASGLEYGKPVTIGDDVWIGGNAVINPGVTIGSNVVIGSGSVVTKSIPDGVIAAGNPCRVIRPITEEDARYWRAQMEAYGNS